MTSKIEISKIQPDPFEDILGLSNIPWDNEQRNDANYIACEINEKNRIIKIAYGKTQAGALDNLLSK